VRASSASLEGWQQSLLHILRGAQARAPQDDGGALSPRRIASGCYVHAGKYLTDSRMKGGIIIPVEPVERPPPRPSPASGRGRLQRSLWLGSLNREKVRPQRGRVIGLSLVSSRPVGSKLPRPDSVSSPSPACGGGSGWGRFSGYGSDGFPTDQTDMIPDRFPMHPREGTRAGRIRSPNRRVRAKAW